MRPSRIVVVGVFSGQVVEVACAKHDELPETLVFDGLDESLHATVEVWRGHWEFDGVDSTLRQLCQKLFRELGIAITDKIDVLIFGLWQLAQERLRLLCDPLRVRASCRLRDDDAAAVDVHEDKHVELYDSPASHRTVNRHIVSEQPENFQKFARGFSREYEVGSRANQGACR